MDLEKIIAHGNRGHQLPPNRGGNMVTCADGYTLSVIAGGGTYCTPKPAMCYCFYGSMMSEPEHWVDDFAGQGTEPHDYSGPYTHLEVGFPSERPEPWDQWDIYAENRDHPTETVYSYVPVDLVRELVAAHGGQQLPG